MRPSNEYWNTETRRWAVSPDSLGIWNHLKLLLVFPCVDFVFDTYWLGKLRRLYSVFTRESWIIFRAQDKVDTNRFGEKNLPLFRPRDFSKYHNCLWYSSCITGWCFDEEHWLPMPLLISLWNKPCFFCPIKKASPFDDFNKTETVSKKSKCLLPFIFDCRESWHMISLLLPMLLGIIEPRQAWSYNAIGRNCEE